ncbi:MAG: hypothetical protein ACI97P_001116 [Arcticibacterium sp.]
MKNKKNQDNQHPFQIDKNYFDNLEMTLLSKAKGDKYHLPLGLSHPFMAPDGYLASFELKKEKFLKLGIKHPYQTPNGYFEQLETRVLARTEVIPQKHESTPTLQVSWRNYVTYARIAAVVLITGLFSLFFFENPLTEKSDELNLATLHSDDILRYLEEENLVFDDFTEVIYLDTDFVINQDQKIEIQEFTEDELLELIDFQFPNEI